MAALLLRPRGIERDRKGPLFRAASRRTKELADSPMSRVDVWCVIRRRASDAGCPASTISLDGRQLFLRHCDGERLPHVLRHGHTDYLTNGGRIEVAQRMAGHSSAKTTGLYDRRNDDVSLDEVERIGI